MVLSPDGQPLKTISLYEAFRDSDFSMLFATQIWRNSGHTPNENEMAYHDRMPPLEGVVPGDVVHANSVKVLPEALAAQFPQFKPGWVLLSFRSSSILALIDPEKGHVVWAAIGPGSPSTTRSSFPTAACCSSTISAPPPGARPGVRPGVPCHSLGVHLRGSLQTDRRALSGRLPAAC